MLKAGDWIREKSSGRMGWIKKIHEKRPVACQCGKSHVIFHDYEIEPAPLSLTKDDYFEMQQIAVEMNDKQWFSELSKNLELIK